MIEAHPNRKMGKGSTRSSYAMRQTGGDSDGILRKPSKKLKKLSSVGETYQSTSSKRVKLPKKFFDDCGTVNHSSVPRKVRSVMKKRHDESVSLSIRNGIRRSEMPSKDRNKKLKVDMDEQQHSTMSESITVQITEDENEVMAALLAMAGIVPGNDNTDEINLKSITSEAEASSLQENNGSKPTCEAATASKSEDLVQKHVQIQNLNEATNILVVKKDSEDITDGKKSQKRCVLHVFICRIIKDLQVTEGKLVNSHKVPKRRDYADAKTNMMPENTTNGNAGKISKKSSTANKTLLQDQWHAGRVDVTSPSVAKNHAGVPVKPCVDAGSEQVPALPYFGSPHCDPSQWPRPVFPNHQSWMNPFAPGARYQNGGHETMPPLSGCYAGMSGSKYIQPSLLDVLGSKDAQTMPHQLQYKMQFRNRPSGYEEHRGLVFVDSSPTLKLTL